MHSFYLPQKIIADGDTHRVDNRLVYERDILGQDNVEENSHFYLFVKVPPDQEQEGSYAGARIDEVHQLIDLDFFILFSALQTDHGPLLQVKPVGKQQLLRYFALWLLFFVYNNFHFGQEETGLTALEDCFDQQFIDKDEESQKLLAFERISKAPGDIEGEVVDWVDVDHDEEVFEVVSDVAPGFQVLFESFGDGNAHVANRVLIELLPNCAYNYWN